MYKIDKDVPMSKTNRYGGSIKYPFHELEVNDSFFVPRVDCKREDYRPYPPPRLKIKIRTEKRVENGVPGIRVWRIA